MIFTKQQEMYASFHLHKYLNINILPFLHITAHLALQGISQFSHSDHLLEHNSD